METLSSTVRFKRMPGTGPNLLLSNFRGLITISPQRGVTEEKLRGYSAVLKRPLPVRMPNPNRFKARVQGQAILIWASL